MKKESIPNQQKITCDPFTGSKKIYVKGQLHKDVAEAMREISLTDTALHGKKGATEKNAPVTVYDTSGPYTDPNVIIDVKKGLSPLREKWIIDRNDTEQFQQVSSSYGMERLNNEKLDAFRFEHLRKPRRAKSGANVSRLHCAK